MNITINKNNFTDMLESSFVELQEEFEKLQKELEILKKITNKDKRKWRINKSKKNKKRRR